jgi:archaeal cell division control protein 6
MKKNLLMWEESLFRDPEVFEIDYVPDQFEFRDTQMRELSFQIRPGLRGGRPLNTICKGLPGTGKTTSIRKLFSEIEETTKKLVPVHINCQIDNTKFAILSQIYRKLSGHLPPASGTSFKQVFDSVARILTQDEIVLLIALDDANYLLYEGEINQVLYALLRSHEAHEKTRIGVIVIVSDMDVDIANTVDARVSSVFRPTELYFPPYAKEEMHEILKARVMQGFYPGVISDFLLDRVVGQTLKAGDLRVGIDILKRAALNAERDARRQISSEDINQAYDVSRFLHLAHTIRMLSGEERQILRRFAELNREGTEMHTGWAYESVHETIAIGYTRFYEIVKKMEAVRLLDLNYREGRGRSTGITLHYEPEKVLEYLG